MMFHATIGWTFLREFEKPHKIDYSLVQSVFSYKFSNDKPKISQISEI